MLIVDSMVNNVTVDLMPGPKSGLTSLRLSPGGMGFFPRPGTLLNSPLSQLHYPPSPCAGVFQNTFASWKNKRTGCLEQEGMQWEVLPTPSDDSLAVKAQVLLCDG